MNIGFDAKRAFENNTGLGQYSRTLIANLAKSFSENKYFLFAPKITSLFTISFLKNIKVITTKKVFKEVWRGKTVIKNLLENNIDIYHGLSHQIPIGISKTKIKSVVTIHDLIFERYPKQHGFINVLLYRKKFKYACQNANAIIAISEQTKNDIIQFYKIDADKITVCYQTCSPKYFEKKSTAELQKIKQQYHLPEKFILSVGSITERKNLLILCKALLLVKNNLPVVVIGNGKKYKNVIVQFLEKNNLSNKVIFLNDTAAAQTEDFKNGNDFAAIYQQASLFVYTSTFEGFGIPLLEAMWSGVPVISSNTSCMPETAGDAALYFSPVNEKELALLIDKVLDSENLQNEMIQKGFTQAKKFTEEICTNSVMEVYKKIYNNV
jgi:glycosyltransferase involved in cell wall biosynthesis